jgi:hypothetical protein
MFKGEEEGEEEERNTSGVNPAGSKSTDRNRRIDEREEERLQETDRERERADGPAMAAGSRLVRERRSGFAVEVKIARGRIGFGRGRWRAQGGGVGRGRRQQSTTSSRERGFALSLLAGGPSGLQTHEERRGG